MIGYTIGNDETGGTYVENPEGTKRFYASYSLDRGTADVAALVADMNQRIEKMVTSCRDCAEVNGI